MSNNKAKKILIVEDEPFLLDMYKFAFECAGYQVLTAQSKEQGLKLSLQEKPDIMLLDIIIPSIENGLVDYTSKEGFYLLQDLRKHPELKNLPVVVFTNLDEDYKTQEKFQQLNVRDFVVKSNYSPQQLVQHVIKLV